MTFTDAFSRPDDPTGLGPDWVTHYGAMAIAGGRARPVGATRWAYSSPATGMPGNDAEVSVTLGPSDGTIDHFMLYVGGNSAGQMIFAYFYQGQVYWWYQSAWASYSLQHGPINFPHAEGDTITLRRIGTLHSILKNGVPVGISFTNSSVPMDADHHWAGFGLYSDDGARYRTIESFAVTPLSFEYAPPTTVNEGEALYLGSDAVDAVYLGREKVWPSGSAWSPAELPNLTVWLDASQLGLADGVGLVSWPDLSGGNHHGAVVASPPPTLRTNALNGLPVVRFKFDEGRVRGDGMCANGSFDVSVLYVARTVGPTVGRVFTNTYPPFNFLVGIHSSGEPQMYDNGWVGNNYGWERGVPGPWSLYEAICTNTPTVRSEFWMDGALRGFSNTSNGHDSRWNLSGYDATSNQETCDCEVAELVIYDRALSSAERLAVEQYLQTKWGL